MIIPYSSFKRISKKSLLILFLVSNFNPGLASENLNYKDQKKVANDPNFVYEEEIQSSKYILGPGDVIGLKLFDLPEFNSNLIILNDNTSTFPLIGNVEIDNLTIKQAEEKLTKLYMKDIINPIVTLEIIKARPTRVTLIGEVQRPGYYSLSNNESSDVLGKSSSISGLPTIVDALKIGGGVTPEANLTNISIRRRLPGKKLAFKEAKVNILSLFEKGSIDQNLFLFDGDVIKIETAKFSAERITKLSALNLSPDFISVNVVGEVKEPGIKQISANASLSEVLMTAGGLKQWRAKKADIVVIRFSNNGSVSKNSYKYNLGQNVSNKKNPPLKDRDIVFVKTSAYGKATDTITEIGKPFTGILNIYGLLKIISE
tara:strand:- start:28343 stop:29461 length:1119 start_codon:yes stop_codon:yes gene_type:complete